MTACLTAPTDWFGLAQSKYHRRGQLSSVQLLLKIDLPCIQTLKSHDPRYRRNMTVQGFFQSGMFRYIIALHENIISRNPLRGRFKYFNSV